MELPSLDLVTLLFKLLPGFVALGVFHALTAYPKRGAFDRIIAALIFTLVAELGVAVIKATFLWIGSLGYSLCAWSDHVQLGWAAGVGVLSGVAWAYAVNKGYTHALLRK